MEITTKNEIPSGQLLKLSIKKIITKGNAAKFGDFLKLHSGRDEFTKLKLPALKKPARLKQLY
jgi:hypothetical protein